VCGIFGVVRPSGVKPEDRADFDAVGALLRHRGPDGDGYIVTDRALLGMHRLSIMDVDHGWQPFWSEDGKVGVLGNGEIYNAKELRDGLVARGHVLKTHSDIEIVAHLFEESGIDCAKKLRGMFALVVLDNRSSEVVLIRDRLGEKPLSFTHQKDALFFSSEQTPLVKAGIVPLRLDDEVVPQYLLHGFVPEPHSIISGIEKVPAAHALRISLADGSMKMVRYWDPLDYVGDRELSTKDLANAVESAVVAACASDVPVGIALSGGLDSSMIAAIAARERSDLQAFTIGYDEPGFDEASAAAAFAAELGIQCHVTILDTQTIAEQFGEICGMRDEPISDIAGPALAALPRAARAAGVPVLMTGVGGDELFWGYEWIRHLAAWTTTYTDKALPRNTAQRLGVTRPPSTPQGMVAWALSGAGVRTERDLTKFMKHWSTDHSVPLPLYEFQYGYCRIIRAINSLTDVNADFPTPEFFGTPSPGMKGAEYTSASNETYLRVNSLTQIDRLSMHYSIESRTPFADHLLQETVMSGRLDKTQVFEPTKTRQRAVAAELLPPHIVNRPKRGFTPPVRKWARAIWMANPEALEGSASIGHSSLDSSATREILSRPIDRIGRVDQMALRLLTLELWVRSIK
jgi:asparagine synthase (glutamine-hydrolysing)